MPSHRVKHFRPVEGNFNALNGRGLSMYYIVITEDGGYYEVGSDSYGELMSDLRADGIRVIDVIKMDKNNEEVTV